MAHELSPEERELVEAIQDALQKAEDKTNKLLAIQKKAGRAEAENDVFSFKAALLTAHAHGTDRLLHMCHVDDVGPIILAGHR